MACHVDLLNSNANILFKIRMFITNINIFMKKSIYDSEIVPPDKYQMGKILGHFGSKISPN